MYVAGEINPDQLLTKWPAAEYGADTAPPPEAEIETTAEPETGDLQ